MYFPSSSASDAGKLSWCSWKSSSHTFHTTKPETFYCLILYVLLKMVSFHILGLWKKKKATQIFGILWSVAGGKQTFFLGPNVHCFQQTQYRLRRGMCKRHKGPSTKIPISQNGKKMHFGPHGSEPSNCSTSVFSIMHLHLPNHLLIAGSPYTVQLRSCTVK